LLITCKIMPLYVKLFLKKCKGQLHGGPIMSSKTRSKYFNQGIIRTQKVVLFEYSLSANNLNS